MSETVQDKIDRISKEISEINEKQYELDRMKFDLQGELQCLRKSKVAPLVGKCFLHGDCYYRVLGVPDMDLDSSMFPVLFVDPKRGMIYNSTMHSNAAHDDVDIVAAMPGVEVSEQEFKSGILLMLTKYKTE